MDSTPGGGSTPPSGEGRDPSCPFCPGNEGELPRILWSEEAPDPPGWRVRAVPNRYPAFEAGAEASHEPGLRGRQEVLIESPGHGRDLWRMEVDELARVLRAYAQRFDVVGRDPQVRRVFLFRNRGLSAGASLAHPHAQVIGSGFVPPRVRRMEARLRARGREEGGCLLCTAHRRGRDWRARRLLGSGAFRAFVPEAAEAPYECWIVPRRHAGTFSLSPSETQQLARLLRALLRVYALELGDLSYNLLFHSRSPGDPEDPHLHWWLQVRPRVGVPAGFELGAGLEINPSCPERDGEELRKRLDRALDLPGSPGTPESTLGP